MTLFSFTLDELVDVQSISSGSDSMNIEGESSVLSPSTTSARFTRAESRHSWILEGEKVLRLVAAQNDGQRRDIYETIRSRCGNALDYIQSLRARHCHIHANIEH